MEDVSEPQLVEPLTVVTESATSDKSAVIQHSENIVQNHQRLSLIGQIYNWQFTGTILRLNLPIENSNNIPIFGLKVTPDWVKMKWLMKDTAVTRRVARFCQRKGWTIPMDPTGTVTNIGAAISVIESDDMPDIAFWNQAALGWNGGINYQLRCISNVTTQGKIVFSRQYDVFQPALNYDPTINRTYLPNIRTSQQWRRKNAFMVGDLSRTNDFEIECPYISKYNFVSNIDTNMSAYTGRPTEHSYIWMDISGILSASAGAQECLFEIWIQAAPDFQYIYPTVPRPEMYRPTNYSLDLGYPWVFGAGTNLKFVSDDEIQFVP